MSETRRQSFQAPDEQESNTTTTSAPIPVSVNRHHASSARLTIKGHSYDVTFTPTPGHSPSERQASSLGSRPSRTSKLRTNTPEETLTNVLDLANNSDDADNSSESEAVTIQINVQNEHIKQTDESEFLKERRARLAKIQSIADKQPTLNEQDSLIINVDPSEQAPDAEPAQGWLSWGADLVVSSALYAFNAAKSVVIYVWEHPVITGLSIITAAPSALNALAKDPSKIGKEWWDKMPALMRAEAIFYSSASLGINAVMNAFFLPSAWEKLTLSVKSAVTSPAKFIKALVELGFGLGGALAAAAIAYNAFLWMPIGHITAAAPAFISFAVTLASRYIGVKNIFIRVHNFFSKDARAQAETADLLKHINPEHLLEINNILNQVMDKMNTPSDEKHRIQDPTLPLTKEDLDHIARKFVKRLTDFAKAHPDFVHEKTTSEYAAEYAGVIFDLTFASFILGIPSLLTFTQKGYDGVATIAKFAGTDLSDINIWYKRLIGVVPGLASSALYLDSGTKIRTTLTELAKYLYQHPEKIPAALITLSANGLASFSPKNLAEGIANNPNNIIELSPGIPLSTAYIITNAIAGTLVNTNASVTKAFLQNENKTAHDMTLPDLTTHLAKVNESLASDPTITKFKLFNQAVHPVEATQSEQTVDFTFI